MLNETSRVTRSKLTPSELTRTELTLPDRIARSLFVAAAVGLGWGIRGDFGHLVGAMYPGACLAMGFAYVSGQRSLFRWMPIIAALAALGIGSGGSMSYGILHGYAQADTLVNYSYGFFTLFLQGGTWGTFGGAIVGLMLERQPMRTGQWLGYIGSILFAGWITSFLIVDVAGFHINPPRNNGSIAYMGGAVGQIAWLVCNRRTSGLRGALLGFIGFGLGMSGGRLLGNISAVLQDTTGYSINHWNVMEVSCGLIGGFIYTFGMLGRPYPEPPEKENIPLASAYGIVFVLGIIPLWHHLSRIRPTEKIPEWAKQFEAYGYSDPEQMAHTVINLLNGVCLLGFLGAAFWLFIHYTRRERWAALPVLLLSLTMLLFQGLTSHFFFYPHRANYINMHWVFWILMGAMLIYVAVARPKPDVETAESTDESVGLRRATAWLLGTAGAFGLIVLLAGFVNGETTMRSANTRWPIWAWTSGPFPGAGKSESDKP